MGASHSPATEPGSGERRQAPLRATAPTDSRAGHGRRRFTAVLAAMAVFNAGCYQLVPLESAPRPGIDVVLELNDRGRAELADSIGPAADRIEGRLRSASDGVYQMDVRAVRYLKEPEQVWSGERLRVPMPYVAKGSERRLDKRKSWLLGVASAAALTLAITSVKLIGGGGGEPSDGEGPPPSGQ